VGHGRTQPFSDSERDELGYHILYIREGLGQEKF
jgi:hypothetical protein